MAGMATGVNIGLAVFLFVLAATSIVLHGLFIKIIINERKLQTLPFKMMAILSAVDVIQGSVSMPVFAVYLLYSSNTAIQKFTLPLGHIFMFANVSAVFLISLEQFLALNFSYWHEKHIRAKHFLAGLIVVCALYFASLLVNVFFPSNDHKKANKIVLIIIGVIYWLCILVFQIKIVTTIKKMQLRLRSNSTTANDVVIFKESRKAATMALIVVVVMFVTHAPSIVHLFVYQMDSATDSYTYDILVCVLFTNTFFDALVYPWRYKIIRQRFNTRCRCLCFQQQAEPIQLMHNLIKRSALPEG